MTPNTKNIKKWIAALRSHKYKQGRRCLSQKHRDGQITYCCLGVASLISGAKDWKPGDGGLSYKTNEWLGISGTDVDLIDGRGKRNYATVMNDEDRSSFATIANAIERTYIKPKVRK